MRDRGLFLNKLGYIGICSTNVMAGDVVCIFSGIWIPKILGQRGVRVVAVQNGFLNIEEV
jgi:hypothetical protein